MYYTLFYFSVVVVFLATRTINMLGVYIFRTRWPRLMFSNHPTTSSKNPDFKIHRPFSYAAPLSRETPSTVVFACSSCVTYSSWSHRLRSIRFFLPPPNLNGTLSSLKSCSGDGSERNHTHQNHDQEQGSGAKVENGNPCWW